MSVAATSGREVSHGSSGVTPARLEVLQNRITRCAFIFALHQLSDPGRQEVSTFFSPTKVLVRPHS